MLIVFVLIFVLFYFVHPALFWLLLLMLAVTELYSLVHTAYLLDNDHGGVRSARVLWEEDFYNNPAQRPENTRYIVRLCYRDGTRRKVTLREGDLLLHTLRRRGLLPVA